MINTMGGQIRAFGVITRRSELPTRKSGNPTEIPRDDPRVTGDRIRKGGLPRPIIVITVTDYYLSILLLPQF